jgi:hypothetical protein
VDGFPYCGIGYTLADTNVHITVSGSLIHLFNQDELIVAGNSQSIAFTLNISFPLFPGIDFREYRHCSLSLSIYNTNENDS